MQRNLVFVYGTLRQNEFNHKCLTEEENGRSRLIDIGTTKEKYPLVIASRYNIPYALAAPGKGEYIEGEVYEVDDKMLATLDKLEDHPRYYERKIIKVLLQKSREEVDCWIYLLFKYKPHMMELPFLKAYSSSGNHGKSYCARYLRQGPEEEYWTDVKFVEPTFDCIS
ncbi:putative gamma-glutamylcyclotransferase CG2811 isoform X2 [Procambarus clarkii]|nr:putative gamma-glutamylcyclotransferase CG2811 isoform X1 [Procambarus clarkii]